MKGKAYVGGVGMIPFTKPGRSETYDVMAEQAVRAALADSGVTFDQVQQAYAGHVYGDSTCGQRGLYRVGMSGIPVVNVNNNCATGSSALWLARQAVESGAVDCALAFGFEQMVPGPLPSKWDDRPRALGRFNDVLADLGVVDENAPKAALFFGAAGAAYAEKYDVSPDFFARVSVKARKHAAQNPYAVFRDLVTYEQVLESPRLYGPVTRLQACPPTCGAAAAIVYSEAFAKRHGLRTDVRIAAQALTTDYPDTFDHDPLDLVGRELTVTAAQRVYEEAGVSPSDIRVVELHDCFTVNEVLVAEQLGLTPEGGSEKFILEGDNTYGGKVVINPSGGLLSKGHPLGATGLAQCTELVWQLRGQADARQVDDVTLALQHNLGLGGACVVTLYEKVA
ncbi:lipid-transfer protein [Microbacterium sp. X-17]|uniref:lipid-transfer protein n=1 Tax=Microbacterium sp. X-17 TaxID=3144404 RepID=UPI0031F5D298